MRIEAVQIARTCCRLVPAVVCCVSFMPITEMQRAQADYPSTEPQPIVLSVVVTDSKGQPVSGLKREHFSVREGKVRHEIVHFSAEDEPVAVGIVVDQSTSMRRAATRITQTIAQGVLDFVKMGNPGNRYFVLTFDDESRLLIDWTSGTDPGFSQLNYLFPRSARATALYDACQVALEKIRESSIERRVLLLVTDGEDTNSRISYHTLRRMVRESDVTVYAVGFGETIVDSLRVYASGALKELSAETGGTALFAVDARKTQQAFEAIATELRRQYRIGFVPRSIGKPGELRKIKVEVGASGESEAGGAPAANLGKLKVRARTGYVTRD